MFLWSNGFKNGSRKKIYDEHQKNYQSSGPLLDMNAGPNNAGDADNNILFNILYIAGEKDMTLGMNAGPNNTGDADNEPARIYEQPKLSQVCIYFHFFENLFLKYVFRILGENSKDWLCRTFIK